jgi:prolyl-tRNA editing enzyme YbaK/EbsC (Cys-tRNA(Pro) deacylase)
MSHELSTSARKVQESLHSLGVAFEVKEMSSSTKTAKDAAAALGCLVEQIAKSVVFRASMTNRPILVIASGPIRINESRIAELLQEPIEKADATFVREKTGFAIGGVPPVGHLDKLVTFIDETLSSHDEIWAAAGTPNAVFKLSPSDLERITGGRRVSVQ